MPKDVLNSEDIDHLASLARLAPNAQQRQRYAAQLSTVVDYVTTLQTVPTEGIDARGGVTGLSNVLAEDEVRTAEDPRTVDRELLLGAAPMRHGNLVEVRAVLGGEESGS